MRMQALQVLPVQPEVLAASGLNTTVRGRGLANCDKATRALITALLKRWQAAAKPPDVRSAVSGGAANSGAAAAERSLGSTNGRAAPASERPTNGVATALTESNGAPEVSPEVVAAEQAAEQVTPRHRAAKLRSHASQDVTEPCLRGLQAKAAAVAAAEQMKLLEEQLAAEGDTTLPRIGAFPSRGMLLCTQAQTASLVSRCCLCSLAPSRFVIQVGALQAAAAAAASRPRRQLSAQQAVR